MNKIRIFTALAAVALLASTASCKNPAKETEVLPTTKEEFESMMQAKSDAVKTKMEGITSNDSRDSLIDAFYSELGDFCGKVVLANPDKDFAVDALQVLENVVEPAELDKYVEALSGSNKENEYVQGLIEKNKALEATAEGRMFTDFEVNGVKFSQYIGQGKYVLVDFWASWCGPCRREIPNIKAVYEKYAGEKFDVLSIAVWDEPEKTKAAAKEEGVVWNQIIDAQQIPTKIYGINGIPQIMLFGPDGTIVKRDLRGSNIEKEVRKALGL